MEILSKSGRPVNLEAGVGGGGKLWALDCGGSVPIFGSQGCGVGMSLGGSGDQLLVCLK